MLLPVLLGGAAWIGCGSDTAAKPDAGTGDITVAVITQGSVRGVQDSGAIKFLGIPYAAPPTGNRRWRAPVAPDAFSGTYDASFPRAECVQGSAANPHGSEDCLYLNVYRPTPASGPVSNAPVLVWIHGGGYSSGSGFMFNVMPLAIAQNAVTVSINYRLGAFGFLAHPALSAEENPRRSGNYGILDMQAALRWVRDNIAAFGGDPKNVTIFGESAGGNAMYVLYASPTSAGLFDKVVAMSGGYYRAQPSLATAETTGLTIGATKFACPDTNLDPLAQPSVAVCLRATTVAAILGGSVTEPIVDGKVLTETTPSAFASGRFNRVPLMAGSTHDEGTVFVAFTTDLLGHPVTEANYEALAQASFGVPGTTVSAHYPLASYPTPSQALAAANGDYHMFCGAMQDVDSVSQYVPGSYFYDWDDQTPASAAAFTQGYPPPDPLMNFGAAHSLDVTYWMGLILPGDVTAERQGLSNAMMGYLGNFARTGDPNATGLTPWARYSASNRDVLHMAYPIADGYDAFAAHQCEFWYAAPPSEGLF